MRRAAAAASLVLAVVIVYHNALAAYFFDDDFQWLVGSWSFHPAQLVAFGSLNHFYRPVIDIYFAVMTPLLRGSPVLFHAASIALHPHWVVYRIANDKRTWRAAVIQVRDPAHIVSRFRKTRDPGTPRYCRRAGIVCRQTQLDIAAIALQQSL